MFALSLKNSSKFKLFAVNIFLIVGFSMIELLFMPVKNKLKMNQMI